MLPTERVIGDSGLLVAGERVRLEIRLPWYRSLPLSTVRVEQLVLDNEEIPLEQVRFELRELHVPLSGLEDLTDCFWFVLDSAFLSFPERIEPGSEHRVSATLSLFPPYIPGMKRTNSQSANLVAGEVQ